MSDLFAETESLASALIVRDESATVHDALARSSRADVRNPVLALPGFRALRDLPPDARDLIAAAMRDIQKDARLRADKCWRTHKAPMALYWKAVGVYAGHIARCLSKAPPQ